MGPVSGSQFPRIRAAVVPLYKETSMDKFQTAIGVFADHEAAEKAVKTLTAGGFDMKRLSVVGKGYHSEEKVVGFYNVGDRIKFWGSRGAFWGGFWGLFFGGLFLTAPLTGPVLVVGFLATVIISGIENAVVVGALGALGAALYSIGVPKDSVLQYESRTSRPTASWSWRAARRRKWNARRRSWEQRTPRELKFMLPPPSLSSLTPKVD